jgi:hypothetical protein
MGGGDVAFHHNEDLSKKVITLSPLVKGFAGELSCCCHGKLRCIAQKAGLRRAAQLLHHTLCDWALSGDF